MGRFGHCYRPAVEHGRPAAASRPRKALEFCNQLKRVTSAPVSTWDERLSTVEAAARLRDAGVRASRNRGRLDSASAAVILEAYLSSRRR